MTSYLLSACFQRITPLLPHYRQATRLSNTIPFLLILDYMTLKINAAHKISRIFISIFQSISLYATIRNFLDFDKISSQLHVMLRYHSISYLIISCHMMWYDVWSYHFLSHHITWYCISSPNHITVFNITSSYHLITRYDIATYHIISYHITRYQSISHHLMPYLMREREPTFRYNILSTLAVMSQFKRNLMISVVFK